MHIPDGFLDTKTVVATATLSGVGLSLAARQVRRHLPPQNVPLMGLSAAFVFAAQMLNFPIGGGTSGHLVGATLMASLIGLSPAIVALAAILFIQCVLFADGGWTALGANVLNMALLGSSVGYGVYRLVCRMMGTTLQSRLTGVVFGGWCSTVAASALCAGELVSSGIVESRVVFPAMVGVHALIGIGEGTISALVLVVIARLRPDLLEESSRMPARRAEFVVFGLLSAFALAAFVAPFASPLPDGLERVAESLGFEERGRTLLSSPAPDYKIPGIGASGLATAVAGVVGTGIAFGFAYGLSRLLTRSRTADKA